VSTKKRRGASIDYREEEQGVQHVEHGGGPNTDQSGVTREEGDIEIPFNDQERGRIKRKMKRDGKGYRNSMS